MDIINNEDYFRRKRLHDEYLQKKERIEMMNVNNISLRHITGPERVDTE